MDKEINNFRSTIEKDFGDVDKLGHLRETAVINDIEKKVLDKNLAFY